MQVTKEKVLISSDNPVNRFPEQYRNGGPGRPPGMKNKFTLLKEEMIDVWYEKSGKKKFEEYFEKHFDKALDKIIQIMPKDKDDQPISQGITYNVVNFIVAAKDDSNSRVSSIDKPMANGNIPSVR